MTNRTTLLALASRVEAMRGPTCVVDVEIAIAVGYAGENSEGARDIRADPDDDGWLLFEMAGEACECCNRAPPYTSSLDAAMSLVPSGMLWSVEWAGHQTRDRIASCTIWKPHMPTSIAVAATPALAMASASLRAIAGSMTDD